MRNIEMILQEAANVYEMEPFSPGKIEEYKKEAAFMPGLERLKKAYGKARTDVLTQNLGRSWGVDVEKGYTPEKLSSLLGMYDKPFAKKRYGQYKAKGIGGKFDLKKLREMAANPPKPQGITAVLRGIKAGAAPPPVVGRSGLLDLVKNVMRRRRFEQEYITPDPNRWATQEDRFGQQPATGLDITPEHPLKLLKPDYFGDEDQGLSGLEV